MQNKKYLPKKLINQHGHLPILHLPGGELAVTMQKNRPAGEMAFRDAENET
jgi:hypothetical protein